MLAATKPTFDAIILKLLNFRFGFVFSHSGTHTHSFAQCQSFSFFATINPWNLICLFILVFRSRARWISHLAMLCSSHSRQHSVRLLAFPYYLITSTQNSFKRWQSKLYEFVIKLREMSQDWKYFIGFSSVSISCVCVTIESKINSEN